MMSFVFSLAARAVAFVLGRVGLGHLDPFGAVRRLALGLAAAGVVGLAAWWLWPQGGPDPIRAAVEADRAMQRAKALESENAALRAAQAAQQRILDERAAEQARVEAELERKADEAEKLRAASPDPDRLLWAYDDPWLRAGKK